MIFLILSILGCFNQSRKRVRSNTNVRRTEETNENKEDEKSKNDIKIFPAQPASITPPPAPEMPNFNSNTNRNFLQELNSKKLKKTERVEKNVSNDLINESDIKRGLVRLRKTKKEKRDDRKEELTEAQQTLKKIKNKKANLT